MLHGVCCRGIYAICLARVETETCDVSTIKHDDDSDGEDENGDVDDDGDDGRNGCKLNEIEMLHAANDG